MTFKIWLPLVGSLALLSTTSFAGTISLVTSAAGLSANDSVDWSQLGVDDAMVTGPLTTISANGATVVTSVADTTATLFVNGGPELTPAIGSPFGATDTLLSFFNNGTDNGTGPATINTSAIYGEGAALAADSPGAFTAQIQVFGHSGLLGTVSESSDSSGDPIFIGFLDSAAEVTSATFSLTAGTNVNNETNYLGDFTIDTLMLNEPMASGSTPEPSALLLAAGGLFALGLARRKNS